MNTAYYPRPEILASPELKQGHAVIEASAGTGKTFTLEHLVLDLIIRGQAEIEEILVVTFTEAATRELRERVRALIRKICDRSGDSIPAGSPEDCWKIDDAVRGRLREALFRFDGAAISTIHGFCQRVLSEQAFLGGRLFEQKHTDGAEVFGTVFREEVRTALIEESPVGDALRSWVEQDYTLQELQELLYKCHREGCPDRCPLTPLWDPEGFLRALKSLPPQEELKKAGGALFSNKKTRTTYESHIDNLFDTAGNMTADRNLQKAVAAFMEWAGCKRSLDKVKDRQADNLIRIAGYPDAPPVLKELASGLEDLVLRAAPESSFFAYELLPRIRERLSARKRSLGLIDYDDMLLGVLEAFSGEDARTLLDTLRKRWKYALVDEFQDTDHVQWEIFRRLFVDGTSSHRLFVIGDPKQAIYSFRGADVHTYERAKQYLTGKQNASRLPLTKNFRSTKQLIGAVNKILTAEDSRGQAFFSGLNRYGEPVKCGDETRTATREGKPAVPVHLLQLYGEGEKLSAAAIRHGVACFISEEIHRLINEPEGLMTAAGENEPKSIKLSDIYILTRSGKEGREIGEVLRSYGIPHAFYKQEGLFQTDQAEEVHRLLCAIDSPSDHAARMSAWLTPFFGVPLSDLPRWREAGESHPLTALLLKWKRLADAQAWFRLFDDIVTSSGLARRLIFSGEERALTNYLHLLEILQAEAHSRPVTLNELARGLKARIDGRKMPEGREGDIQRLETDREAVQILTMHKAKGLEAEVIFIGGGFGNPGSSGPKINIYHFNNERRLHIGEATGKIAQAVAAEIDEENQRLMYVALTRAKSCLYLPYFGIPKNQAPGNKVYGYKSLGSFYSGLQQQLDLVVEQGAGDDRDNLFVLRETSTGRRPPMDTDLEISLQGWPERDLIKMPPLSAGEAGQIAPGRRGVLLTSYTRMSRGRGWQAPAADSDDQAARRDEEVAGEARPEGETAGDSSVSAALGGPDAVMEWDAGGKAAPLESIELPGGREAGIFLHTLLEDTPINEIRNCSFEKWSALEQVQKRAGAVARRHGFSNEQLPQALHLVYSALRTPVYVQSREADTALEIPGGFASGERHNAEMSFIYPIPEAFHPLLAASRPPSDRADHLPYKALRGYLQGLIDLVFEYENKVYMLDWKSDRLPSFGPAELDRHVESNYNLQAQVYSLAIVRLLGIGTEEEYSAQFGGIIYVFIRGLRAGSGKSNSAGIWFSRPPWSEIAAWENNLVKRGDWGGEVIE